MKRTATAVWQGSLGEGKGTIDTQSGALKSNGYSFESRFTDESGKAGTNPEELLAAAHAGCFAMQLAHMLAENGTPADELEAVGTVSVDQAGEGLRDHGHQYRPQGLGARHRQGQVRRDRREGPPVLPAVEGAGERGDAGAERDAGLSA